MHVMKEIAMFEYIIDVSIKFRVCVSIQVCEFFLGIPLSKPFEFSGFRSLQGARVFSIATNDSIG